MYHDYIFRIPASCPELTFTGLSAWMGLRHSRMIGTTVTVTWHPATSETIPEISQGRFNVELYGTLIAVIYPDSVRFPGPDDPHVATSEWIGRIVQDNAVGGGVGRVRRRKSDGPGPAVARGQAGLLVIGWDRDRPVFGHSYPVSQEKIQARRQQKARIRERIAQARQAVTRRTWANDTDQETVSP